MNRRDFFAVAGVVTANAAIASELAAGIGSGDMAALTQAQTTHGTDLALAALMNSGEQRILRRWATGGDTPDLRVNATGILAKVPDSRTPKWSRRYWTTTRKPEGSI